MGRVEQGKGQLQACRWGAGGSKKPLEGPHAKLPCGQLPVCARPLPAMAGSIAHIKAPIAAEMELFERKFQEAMKSPVPLLDKITHFIVKRKGKQMRPMFVFFSANLCGGVTEKTYRAAALVELLHTATLVHDDVVDDAYERRGMFSLNALWKNKIAVLVGDYLLSKGLLLSIENDDFQLLKLVSTAVRRMSEGEMLQLEKARRLDITEEIYFEIIERKTASLLASCCACGAESAGAPPELIERLRQLGETIGIAFQIKDDLFDIGEEDTGKPRGTDIKERKMDPAPHPRLKRGAHLAAQAHHQPHQKPCGAPQHCRFSHGVHPRAGRHPLCRSRHAHPPRPRVGVVGHVSGVAQPQQLRRISALHHR